MRDEEVGIGRERAEEEVGGERCGEEGNKSGTGWKQRIGGRRGRGAGEEEKEDQKVEDEGEGANKRGKQGGRNQRIHPLRLFSGRQEPP